MLNRLNQTELLEAIDIVDTASVNCSAPLMYSSTFFKFVKWEIGFFISPGLAFRLLSNVTPEINLEFLRTIARSLPGFFPYSLGLTALLMFGMIVPFHSPQLKRTIDELSPEQKEKVLIQLRKLGFADLQTLTVIHVFLKNVNHYFFRRHDNPLLDVYSLFCSRTAMMKPGWLHYVEQGSGVDHRYADRRLLEVINPVNLPAPPLLVDEQDLPGFEVAQPAAVAMAQHEEEGDHDRPRRRQRVG